MQLKNFFAQDDEGRKMPGATCFVYERGTGNLVNGLRKANGVALSNPFQADGNGLIQFGAPSGLYDVRVASNDRDYRMPVQFLDVSETLEAANDAAARAEVARDVAVQDANLFSSIEEGIRETQDNQPFQVLSNNSDDYLVLYVNKAGVAEQKAVYPSKSLIEKLIQRLVNLLPDSGIRGGFTVDTDGVYRFSVTDAEDQILAGVGEKLIKWMGHLIEKSPAAGLQLFDTAGVSPFRVMENGDLFFGGALFSISADGRLSITDAGGRVAFSIDPKGRAYVLDLTVGDLKVLNPESSQDLPPVALPLGFHQRTDIIHVEVYSQSLGRGDQSLPPISTSQTYGNLMFASGVKVRATDAGFDGTHLVPLVENASGTEGETPVSGICNGISRRLAMRGEDPLAWPILGHSGGRGGQTVESLSEGGIAATFEGLLKTVDAAHAYAVANGKSYSFWAHVWIQGEANVTRDATDALEYANRVLRLDQALADHISASGYQKFRHYLVTYQTGAHRKYGVDSLAIANGQWGISKQHAHVVMASPVYFLPHAADNLHLTNESSWRLGEYISRAIQASCQAHGYKWRPLEPVFVDWQSTYIDIELHVPSGKIILDDALCPYVETGYFGFDIREDGVVASDIITSVSVTSKNTVRVELSRPPAFNALLSYARGRPGDANVSGRTGPRGNLRDTSGEADQVISPLGNTFQLHNACVMFEHHRINGFS